MDKRVLDVCCGVGYGSNHLAPVALSVTGVERSPLAFEYAGRAWHRPNVQFIMSDFLEFRNCGYTVDAVVAFEALEHFKDGLEFLETCAHMLQRDGTLLLSVPPHALSRSKFHKSEYNPNKLETLIDEAGFEALEVYSQTAPEVLAPGYRDDVYSWLVVARKR
jgi:2-polyprenyl-3-methyl-5-hydroxy-6-metoxy-1,4-benzoquinol methylase